MAKLDTSLIKQFVKATDDTNSEKVANTYYATITVNNSGIFAQIDGSSAMMPVLMATDAQNGDRVLVTIEDHTARIVSNLTVPSSGRQARNYISFDETAGLMIADMTEGEETPSTVTTDNVLIDATGVSIRSGQAVLQKVGTVDDEVGSFIYDGEGNNAENVVAKFTDNGVEIGKNIDGQILLEKDSITMTDSTGGMAFRVLQGADEEATTSTKEYMSISNGMLFIQMPTVGEHTQVLSNQYVGSLNVKISLKVSPIWGGDDVTYTVIQTVPNLGSFTININTGGVRGTVAGSISFDDTTSTVTINITTSTYTGDVWAISNSVELTYLTYIKTPTIALGEHADVYDLSDKAIVVGKPTQNGNTFVVHRNGRITTGGHNSPVGTVVDAYVGAGGVEIESGYWLRILEIILDPGVWLLNACVRFPSSTSGIRRANLSLTANDNTLQWVSAPMGSNQVTQGTFSKIFQPTTRTSYYLNVYQNSGSRMTMPEGGAQSVNAIRAIRIV